MQFQASGGDPSVCDQLRPSSWIEGFSDEGQEEVGGVQTDHLKGDIDVHNLMLDLIRIGKSIVAEQGVPLGGFDPDRIAAEIDKYIDKAEVSAYPATTDGIPRKLGLDLSVDAGDSGGVDLTADVAFDHVNEPQTIAPPPGPIKPIETVCVQGAPGTGKTAVGLHRAAYLLFAHREQLTRQGVLVVGPNASFLRYIRDVLPALGEIEATQSTIEELVSERWPVRAEDSAAVATLKGDARLA